MMENSNTMMRIAATCGLILGFIIIVVQVLSIITGISLLLIAAYVGGIIYTTIIYRDNYSDRTISYGKSLLFGVLVSGFTFIIIGVYLYIQISISPDTFRQTFNTILESAKEQGYDVSNVSEDLMFNPLYLLASYLFTGLLIGLAVAAVTSIFTKKK
jgi:hypothetical protein